MLKKQYYKMDAIYYSKLVHEFEKGIKNIFFAIFDDNKLHI